MTSRGYLENQETHHKLTIFNLDSLNRIVTKQQTKILNYELVLIGALLGEVVKLVRQNEQYLDIEHTEFFQSSKTEAMIYVTMDLFNPEDIQRILLLSDIFDSHSKRFSKNPGTLLSERVKTMLRSRMNASASTR